MNVQKTCIICPNGCDLTVTVNDKNVIVAGAACKRGVEYAKQEMLHPVRTISSSVLVCHGNRPLVSVRLNHPIPKEKIMEVMQTIQAVSIDAPVKSGQIIVRDILGLHSDLIATADVEDIAQ